MTTLYKGAENTQQLTNVGFGCPGRSWVTSWVVFCESHGVHSRVALKSQGTWCSGITSASHAEGPGFKSQCVHAHACEDGEERRQIREEEVAPGALAFF